MSKRKRAAARAETPIPAVEPAAPAPPPAAPVAPAPLSLTWVWAGLGLALFAQVLPLFGAARPAYPFYAVAGGLLLAVAAGAAVALARVRQTRPDDERLQTVLLATATISAALALHLRRYADPSIQPLPDAGVLRFPPDLHWGLYAAALAAGLLRLERDGADRAGRLLAGAGGLLLLVQGLHPFYESGDLGLPAIEALKRIFAGTGHVDETSGAVVLLLLCAAGGFGLAASLGARLPAVVLTWLGPVALALLPLWRLGHAHGTTTLAIAGAAGTELGASLALTVLLASLAGAAAAPGPARARISLGLEVTALALLAFGWWVLRLHGLGYSDTDESIYFYAAKNWAEGIWPYKDFFFSHPPVHILVPAVLIKLFGYHFLMCKLIPTVACFLTAIAVHRSARRHLGVLAGVVAPALMLYAAEVLKASTNLTGVNLTTLFLTLGVLAAIDRKPLRAGIWLGVSLATGIYAAAAVLATLLATAFAPARAEPGTPRWRRRDIVPMVAGFAGTFGALMLPFAIMAGDEFFTGVFKYHTLKAPRIKGLRPMSEGPGAMISNFFVFLQGRDLRVNTFYHAPQFWLALLTPVALWLRPRQATPGKARPLWNPRNWWVPGADGRNPEGYILLVLFAMWALVAELAQLNELYDFYWTLLFPLLGLAGAYTVRIWLQLAARAAEPAPAPAPAPKKGAPPPPARTAWIVPAAGLAVVLLWVPIEMWADMKAFPDEYKASRGSRGAGEKLTFQWTPSPRLPAVGELARPVFWMDERTRGSETTAPIQYFMSKKREFSTAPEIAQYIRERTTEEDTITGASDYAPIIALLAGRRLAGNQVDTNNKVFMTRVVPPEKFWEKNCNDRIAYVVAAENSYFAPNDLHRRPVIPTAFHHERTWFDPMLRHRRNLEVQVWRRNLEPPGKICP